MLTKQIAQLKTFRDQFIADNERVSKLLEGREPKVFSETALEELNLEDLKYLASFPDRVKNVFIDANLTIAQIFDEASPVFDLARSTMNLEGRTLGSRVSQAIASLRELRLEKMKALKIQLDQMELERFSDKVNYLEMFNDAGLNEKTCTLKSLSEFDAAKAAKEIRAEIVGVFGFNRLGGILAKEGGRVDLSALEELNPPLYEQLTEDLVNGFSEENLGKTGIIKHGNVKLRFFGEEELERLGEEPDKKTMAIVEVGVRPEFFEIGPDFKAAFPNTPSYRHTPTTLDEAELVLPNWTRKFGSKDGGESFFVTANLFLAQALFRLSFGAINIK